MYIELQPEKTPPIAVENEKKKKRKRGASKKEEAESFVTKQLKNFVRLLLLLFGDITRARQFVFDLKFARFFFKFQDLKWL